MTNSTETSLYEYTQQKLKAHYQNNEAFNQELATVYEYYKIKLTPFVGASHSERMEEMLFASVKSQIFNGYFIALEVLNGDDSNFEDDWFRQGEGMIAQQLPDMLRMVTDNNIEEIITYESLKELSKWLVVEYEGVYPILMDISLNTASMGAKWAFKDEANKRGIDIYTPQYKGILANLDDVTFINPQNYLTLVATNEYSEVWEIINSDYRGLDKIGEITVLKINSGTEQEGYYLNVTVKGQLTSTDQEALIDSVAIRLMVLNEIERENLLITASSVVEYFQFR